MFFANSCKNNCLNVVFSISPSYRDVYTRFDVEKQKWGEGKEIDIKSQSFNSVSGLGASIF